MSSFPAGAGRAQASDGLSNLWIIAGVSVILMLWIAFASPVRFGNSDFIWIRGGGQLAFSGHLYDPDALADCQRQSGRLPPYLSYVRPPFYAVFCYPFGLLPYQGALYLWQAMNFLAVIGFLLLWRVPPGQVGATSLFPPLLCALMFSEDSPLLLLAVAGCCYLLDRKQSFLAGAVVAFCAEKPHLVLLVPVALLLRREWGALKGLATAGAVLTLVSFLSAGWRWPVQALASAARNARLFHWEAKMPTLRGALVGLPNPEWLYVAGALVLVAFGVAGIARAKDHRQAMGVALAISLAIAPHAFLYDGTMLLPGLLTAFERRSPYLATASIVGIGLVLYAGVIMTQAFAGLTTVATAVALAAIPYLSARRGETICRTA